MPTTVSKAELDQLAACIVAYRKRTGATVTQIAKDAGVARRLVSQLAAGSYESCPSIAIVTRICDVIGASIRIEMND